MHSASNTEDDPLMNVPAVATYLGVHPQTLYGWRHEGRGPKALKVGRSLRFRKSDVDEWLMDPHRIR